MFKIYSVKPVDSVGSCFTASVQPEFIIDTGMEKIASCSMEISTAAGEPVWQKGKTMTGTRIFRYTGVALTPFKRYKVHTVAVNKAGETAVHDCDIEPVSITDECTPLSIAFPHFKLHHALPGRHVTFRRDFTVYRQIQKAVFVMNCVGEYIVTINGSRVCFEGQTRQSNTCCIAVDVTKYIRQENIILASSLTPSVRQKFSCVIALTMADGSVEIMRTDENWLVSTDGTLASASIFGHHDTYQNAAFYFVSVVRANVKKNLSSGKESGKMFLSPQRT